MTEQRPVPRSTVMVDRSCGDDAEAESMWSYGISPNKWLCNRCLAEESAEVIATAVPDDGRPCEGHHPRDVPPWKCTTKR